jgi:hypothetical protein
VAVRDILAKLREAQIPCVSCQATEALDYAQAWRYSHLLCAADNHESVSVVQLSKDQQLDLGSSPLNEFVKKLQRNGSAFMSAR